MAAEDGTDGDGAVVAEDVAATVEEPLSDRWIDLFRDDAAPQHEPEMFKEAIGDVERLLAMRPEARDETLALLDREFARPLGKNTWANVTSSLARYAGVPAAYLLNWLVFQNTDSRLAALDEQADPRVAAYARTVVSRFWDELNAAQITVTASADDWTKIDKHVLYDALTGSYRFTITLTKVGGDVVSLELTGDSLMNLAGHLLAMIAAVGNPEEFTLDRRGTFVEQMSAAYAAVMRSDAAAAEPDGSAG